MAPTDMSKGTIDPESPAIPVISAAELRAADFEAPVRNNKSTASFHLAAAYIDAGAILDVKVDAAKRQVYALINAILSIHLSPDDKAGPWLARASGPGWRTATPAMFAGQQSDELFAVLPDVIHPALRARLADIIWTNDRRRGAAATAAYSAYRECIEGLLSGTFKPFIDNDISYLSDAYVLLHRMLQVIQGSTKKSKRPDWLITTFMAVYDRANLPVGCVFFAKVAELGLHYDLLKDAQVALDCEALAGSALASVYPDAVRRPFDLAARLFHKLGDKDAVQRCRLGALACTFRMREQVSGNPGAEATWVMVALQELRHITGQESQKLALEQELRALQKASLDQMVDIPINIDVADDRSRIVEAFSNLTLSDALRDFARISISESPDVLRQNALRTAEHAPIIAMMGIRHIDAEGRTAHLSDGAPAEGDPSESWFDNMINRSESIRRYQTVAAAIDPVRLFLYSKFGLTEDHFAPIVQASAFVPEAQMPLVSLGIARLFQGDLMSAVHLIIPQLEPCLRHILKLNGVDPSKRRDDDTEEDLSLSGLYNWHGEHLVRIFGGPLHEEMERLYNRRPGPSLRNELAHGQISAGACFSPDAYYGCWLFYRVCCLFAFQSWEDYVALQLSDAVGGGGY